MFRLVTYPIAMAATAGLLALFVLDKSGSLFLALAVAGQVAAVWVTWLVARREHRSTLPWVLLAVLIGPFAWIAMVARRPADEPATSSASASCR
jgi:hypothetical protein